MYPWMSHGTARWSEELERTVMGLRTNEWSQELQRTVAELRTNEWSQELQRTVMELRTNSWSEDLQRMVAELRTKSWSEDIERGIQDLRTRQVDHTSVGGVSKAQHTDVGLTARRAPASPTSLASAPSTTASISKQADTRTATNAKRRAGPSTLTAAPRPRTRSTARLQRRMSRVETEVADLKVLHLEILNTLEGWQADWFLAQLKAQHPEDDE